MSEHRYVLADTADEFERARLQLVEAHADPDTQRRLTNLGVGEGWHCLEVGAGAGSVTRWLADRVGPTGGVVATDINPRFLTDLPANVEVRQHDILSDPLETGAFDVVHCRATLMHLPEQAGALERMTSAVRPGGWLLAEEGDYALVAVVGHPDAGWATALFHRIVAGYVEAGITNLYFGRSLLTLVSELGLEAVGAEVITPVVRAGDPHFEMHRQNMAYGREVTASLGIATDDELGRLDAVMANPRTVLVGGTRFAAWGRTPS